MTSPLMSSSSPQWDSRNRGFISPAGLQQLRRSSPGRADVHDFQARPPNGDSEARDNPDDATQQPPTQPRAMPPPSHSHARTSSFFSFRTKPHQEEPAQDPTPNPTPNALHSTRPSNLNGTLPADFGGSAPQMGQSMSLGPTKSFTDQQLDQQQPPTAIRRASITGGLPASAPLHPEIRSVVQLTLAHARKVYYSGPLVKRLERQPDGQRPLKDEGWVDVWAQLGGTTLSIWDMREVDEANKQGKEVPPAYFNTTDAFVQVLGSITIPATDGQPQKKFTNVLTLNTAGSNLLLFSCPSTPALVSWATALRLSAWEKSRLEEIYTAHLIRITLPGGKDTHSTLHRGRMEGWVRIRVAGQTDWKRMWMVVSAGSQPEAPGSSYGEGGTSNVARKKRMSSLFLRDQVEDLQPRPLLSLYASSKPKDKKKALLTFRDLTQAFAVYPERPELINRSTLMKLEGLLGDEETAGGMRGREGWLLVMPELEAGNTQASEMLKWLVALHDAFELYGRPRSYTWDPRDPVSMMFAYPVGPSRDLLFLDRELAETTDPRNDRTSTIRSCLLNVLRERIPQIDPQSRLGAPPALPALSLGTQPSQQYSLPAPPASQTTDQSLQLPQLPSLNFDATPSQAQSRPIDSALGRTLTPITELASAHETQSDLARAPGHSLTTDQPHGSQLPSSESEENEPLAKFVAATASIVQEGGESGLALGQPMVSSPPPRTGASRKRSGDSFEKGAGSRPDSKLSPTVENGTAKSQEASAVSGNVAEVMGVKLPFSPLASPELPSFSTNSSMSVHSPTPGNHASALQSPISPSSLGRSSRSRTSSPTFSILTSPHSLLEKDLPSIQAMQTTQPSRSLARSASSAVPPVPDKPMSTSPQFFSSTPISKVTPAPPPVDPQSVFSDALFFMQQLDEKSAPPRRVPTTISEKSDSTSVSELSTPVHASLSGTASPSQPAQSGVASEPSLSASRLALGRKPSGARALPASGASRVLNLDTSSTSLLELHRVPDSDSETMSDNPEADAAVGSKKAQLEDVNVDALAALSFLDSEAATSSLPEQPTASLSTPDTTRTPPPPPHPQPSPQLEEISSGAGSSDNAGVYKSTFAPSKQAVQRKARIQAQQAAHQAAVHRPGRANGKRGSATRVSGWNETSDEDEEEEEEEEDDADSDDEPSTTGSKQASQASSQAPTSAPTVAPVSAAPIRPLRPQSRGQSPAEVATATDANPYAQLRHPRGLPPLPRPQTQGAPTTQDDYFSSMPPQRRFASDSRSRTPDEAAPHRHPSELPQPPAPRHSIWTQVLDSSRQPGTYQTPPEAPTQPQRDTFVQIEPASQTMTKAFTPHGLLSAGMHDKQDRSAKRQEELAREMGASLINVPNKPPPPQTGLLGAITAHERERKREGGVGAALTEREREKRLAEDRQRKLDELQRQQLEMAQSAMFSGQFPMGMNPMMGNPMMNQMMPLNPMMTGTGPMMPSANPMMTGGFMGYPNMMPGYGGQPYMFAAQQAAQAAYQQAMMAFSAGGDGMHGPSPLTPMMTGGGMGFDPRMSMMGMPMMSPGMPMGGVGGGMGLMGNMGGMGSMGMQMTGGSAFDARFPPNAVGGPHRPGNHSSRNSSAGQGSPAGPRALDAPERSRDNPKN